VRRILVVLIVTVVKDKEERGEWGGLWGNVILVWPRAILLNTVVRKSKHE